MEEITIVTSFFDINREKFANKALARSCEKYVEYFKTWARIRNHLIIYTEPKMKDAFLGVREAFGLRDKTTIIVIDDFYNILPDYYKKMCLIEQNKSFINFRYFTNAMSNEARYCYLVMLQYWFINDAVERDLVKENVAWIDIGFNHGLEYYTDPKQFDFVWRFPFDKKINCFALFNPDNLFSMDGLQFQKDCFMGGLMVLHKSKALDFWEYIKEAVNALFMLECIDDDQQLLMMAYKAHPEAFTIRICNWFEPLRICGGEHLSYKKPEKEPIFQRIKVALLKGTGLAYRKFLYRSYKRVKSLEGYKYVDKER